MTKFISVFFSVIIIFSGICFAEEDIYFIKIDFNKGNYDLANSEFGSQIIQTKLFNTFTGNYYETESGTSSISTSKATEGNLIYEMNYSLSIKKDQDRLFLYGNIYSINYDGQKIVGGNKIFIDEAIDYYEPVRIAIGEISDGEYLNVIVNISEDARIRKFDYSNNKVTLITNQFENNKIISTIRNGYGFLKDSMIIEKSLTSFDENSDIKKGKKAIYKTILIFNPIIENCTYPFNTYIQFTRFLMIDTNYSFLARNEPFDNDVGYASGFSKPITLSEDNIIKLVFPPDELPEADYFQFEDTLIISP